MFVPLAHPSCLRPRCSAANLTRPPACPDPAAGGLGHGCAAQLCGTPPAGGQQRFPSALPGRPAQACGRQRQLGQRCGRAAEAAR